MTDHKLAHARRLLLEIAKLPDPLDPSARDIGFSVLPCDPTCGWDDGLGRCGRPLANTCVVRNYDQIAVVNFCADHGEVMFAAMVEFKNAKPRN